MKKTVLFLCATNGMQSPMAEALLRRIDSEHFEAFSAGIQAGPIHPFAVEVMLEAGLNIERKIPTAVHDLLNRQFDFVISLAEGLTGKWIQFSGAEMIHWHFEDPMVTTDPERQKRAFRALRDQIAQRLHLFVLVQVRAKTVTPSVRRDQPARAVSRLA
jgi:protein-tyrosine-phosphatase